MEFILGFILGSIASIFIMSRRKKLESVCEEDPLTTYYQDKQF